MKTTRKPISFRSVTEELYELTERQRATFPERNDIDPKGWFLYVVSGSFFFRSLISRVTSAISSCSAAAAMIETTAISK